MVKEGTRPSISNYGFLRLFSASTIAQGLNPIIENHQLEKDLCNYYGRAEYHFLFEDVGLHKDKFSRDGNYVDLNTAFQLGYANEFLLMLQDGYKLQSVINITKEQAKDILSSFEVEQVNAMNDLCNELNNSKIQESNRFVKR